MRRCLAAAAGVASFLAIGTSAALAIGGPGGIFSTGEIRQLTLHNLHTGEDATIIFKRDGVYDEEGLAKLEYILRDVRDNKTYDMDPHLFDLVWEVYQATGATQPVQIICGYRTPHTNEWLRDRSDGVAENSLHMKGKALDFYIPGVPLAKLRAIGLQMQAGGVGFYPSSGSPFVHLDTGSVRHWPTMTRQQLLAVFPDGKILSIPSDGQPLPGYKEALAAYKERQANLTPATRVANFPGGQPKGLFGKVQVASAAATKTTAEARQAVGVAVAAYSTDPVFMPKPNLAPRAEPAAVVTAVPTPKVAPAAPAPLSTAVAANRRPTSPRAADFASADYWTAPAVPAVLVAALRPAAPRTPGASLPIQPTAVVATVSITRPLDPAAAAAVTSAVIRGEAAPVAPALLAYASVAPLPAPKAQQALGSASPLTMTALDTEGLKLWMGSSSTRQRTYARLTMPDFAPTAALMSAATAAASTFGAGPAALRTDRFAPVERR